MLRRQAKFRDPATSAESSMKLQSAEAKLNELKSAMMALGREATAAMLSVEAQQQRITFQRLLTMVVCLFISWSFFCMRFSFFFFFFWFS